MKMNKVESSNIELIGHTQNYSPSFGKEPENILRIKFVNGRTYDYYGVDKEVFEKMLEAKSVGSFFHKHINKQYDYELVKNG